VIGAAGAAALLAQLWSLERAAALPEAFGAK
jgi:hypothetical protein